MTAKSREQWPTEFKIVKVSDSFIGKELTFFFVTGIVNRNQSKYVRESINVLAEQEIETDKVVISTLLNQVELEKFNRDWESRSREWRGQYYSLANAIVDACSDALKS